MPKKLYTDGNVRIEKGRKESEAKKYLVLFHSI